MKIPSLHACAFFCLLFASAAHAAQPDVIFADFESENYGDWTPSGTAFGNGPATGTLAGQMDVSGFAGKRLVNSFNGGDNSTGTLTSPAFKIDRKFIAFLIGGGGFEGKTCINLIIADKIVRTATGQNTEAGGHEMLEQASWDVSDLAGQTAKLQIVDDAIGGWGHILIDQVVFTDTKIVTAQLNPSREIVANHKLLNFPIKNGAKVRNAKVFVDGKAVREFTIECADGQPDWWAPLDVSAWQGKTLKIEVDKLPANSKFLASVESASDRKGAENLYAEPLRPQFHFSPSRGWNNDPNGLCFHNGEYHLFFQLNPYGVNWGNMHWGHAVSKDLLHWNEVDIALYPEGHGMMFSGSAVVDWKNTSGFGVDGKPPLVALYTEWGTPPTQCLAYSNDGRTFTKYASNPVVKHIGGGNRDPKVIWHEPTKQWVMALFVDFPIPGKKERQTIHFLTSPNLKDWTITGQIDDFFECPDLFALPVDGDPKNVKWVLTAASSEYRVGQFDGKTFVPESTKLKGHQGRGFYAAQTFSDMPDGRRIQIGWLQTPSPGMAFNQSMSVPLELKLISTADGARLTWSPAKELESLRGAATLIGSADLTPESPQKIDAGELLDLRLEFEPGNARQIHLNVRGVSIGYDIQKQELSVDDLKAPAPLRAGKQRLIVLADRNSFEVFASDGLTYVPFPVIPKMENRSVTISSEGGTAKIISLGVHQLKSAWGK